MTDSESPLAGTALARRKTVADLVSQRNHALQLFQDAHAVLLTAEGALSVARTAAQTACNGVNRYNHHHEDEKRHFFTSLKVLTPEDYMARARRMIDTDCWAHVIQLTDLETMMDKTAKDQFNQQLLSDPPEFTIDNVLATLDQFLLDAGTIFRRGIATCFSKLDRRFRSHDGWKIGSRIILTYVFSADGYWNYHSNHRDTFMDVERVFRVLDGEPAKFCGLNAALETARGRGWGARQTEVETEYFLVRCWKNGNAHVWFKRKDLVAKVNRLIGEYYGAPIPDGQEPEDDGGLHIPKMTLAKNYGFFPTPEPAVEHFLHDVRTTRHKDEPRLTILEPNAGTGNLARWCLRPLDKDTWRADEYRHDPLVDCIEIQPALADALRAERTFRRVFTADFLQVSPETTGLYDLVVMNPPFDRERDIDHVMHALEFVKPGGQLCAIMSAGTEFRDTRKSKAFRELMNSLDATWKDMPEASFASVGTHCNTGALYVRKGATAVKPSRYNRPAFKEAA